MRELLRITNAAKDPLVTATPAHPAFDENSIRADDLVAECDRLHVTDLARLASRAAEFLDVECPACGERRPQPLWQRDGFAFVRCGSCETGYVNPRPPPDVLDWHYRNSESHVLWAERIYPQSESSRRTHIHGPRVSRVIEICESRGIQQGGTLIEVGPGFGTFCVEAKSRDWFSKILAVEPTPSNAKACRERGVEVLELQIENAHLTAGAADVVTSFEVIEHLSSPEAFVKGCASVLRPGGLLVLSCPNLKGFELATLGIRSPSVDPEHLNYFHPASLSSLLRRCGLNVLEVLTPGALDADIVRKRVGADELSSQPFLRAVLRDQWAQLGGPFQSFLAQNQLSSHMWAVAQKPA
jgi:2-polyprenyl-3-methyl-5-hydroxy-6-metoxy-1,4-benzoquinol methylase